MTYQKNSERKGAMKRVKRLWWFPLFLGMGCGCSFAGKWGIVAAATLTGVLLLSIPILYICTKLSHRLTPARESQ